MQLNLAPQKKVSHTKAPGDVLILVRTVQGEREWPFTHSTWPKATEAPVQQRVVVASLRTWQKMIRLMGTLLTRQHPVTQNRCCRTYLHWLATSTHGVWESCPAKSYRSTLQGVCSICGTACVNYLQKKITELLHILSRTTLFNNNFAQYQHALNVFRCLKTLWASHTQS